MNNRAAITSFVAMISHRAPCRLLLFAALGLVSCQTTHDVAVSTFRVLDAPAVYVRNKLNLDNNDADRATENPPATTTTTRTTDSVTNFPPNNGAVYPQPFNQPGASTPTVTARETAAPPIQRQVVVTEHVAANPTPPPAKSKPTPRPTIIANEKPPNESTPGAKPRVASSDKATPPYAKPVPGKPGYVFSPFDPNGGYVDVTGFAPGAKVKDPYSGKVFLVP